MERPPYLLLPPSEGKTSGGTRRQTPDDFAPHLNEERAHVVAALAKTLARSSNHDRDKLVNARGALAQRGLDALEAYVAGEAPLLPAWRRYDGVVWRHLAPASLSAPQRRRILVPSSLYGVTTANDVIADYRLKMNVRLKTTGVLASYWRSLLTSVLVAHVGSHPLVDLLPGEHRAAFDVDALRDVVDYVRVSFVHQNNARAVGHDAKAVKGVVARRLVLEGLGGLEDFTWGGWRVAHSDEGFVVVAPGS